MHQAADIPALRDRLVNFVREFHAVTGSHAMIDCLSEPDILALQALDGVTTLTDAVAACETSLAFLETFRRKELKASQDFVDATARLFDQHAGCELIRRQFGEMLSRLQYGGSFGAQCCHDRCESEGRLHQLLGRVSETHCFVEGAGDVVLYSEEAAQAQHLPLHHRTAYVSTSAASEESDLSAENVLCDSEVSTALPAKWFARSRQFQQRPATSPREAMRNTSGVFTATAAQGGRTVSLAPQFLTSAQSPATSLSSTRSVGSRLSSAVVHGEERACSLCGSLLGKRRLNPRHHCRMCNRAACGTCCKPIRICRDCCGGTQSPFVSPRGGMQSPFVSPRS